MLSSSEESTDDEHTYDRPYDMPIHVLEIAGNAIVGGMEKYVYNMAQHLPAQNFKVSVLAPYHSAFTGSLRNLGCETYITEMDIDPFWRSIQFTSELVRHQRVDLIHAHLPRAHVLAGVVGRLVNVPVVATVHGMEITSQELGISRLTGTNLTVVCQQAFSQALALGIPAERLTLITNGVDTKTFNPNRTGASFRRAMHISPDATLVGFVGRLAWEKGPDQFIQMAAKVHQKAPSVQFAIVGDGPFEAELRELICNLGAEDYIHMAGLWTNTWEVYPAFDILATTSRIEGMPFTLLEGMACGKPVVALSIGGIGEVVEVGSTGLVSHAGDWEGLADAVLKMLDNPEQLRQMGQAARKRIEELYDIRDGVQLMGNLFHRLLGQSIPEQKEAEKEPLEPSWSFTKGRNETIAIDPTLFTKRK